MSGIYSDTLHGLGLEPRQGPFGPRLTPEISNHLEDQMAYAIKEAMEIESTLQDQIDWVTRHMRGVYRDIWAEGGKIGPSV